MQTSTAARWSLRDVRTHLALILPAISWFAPQLFFGRVAYFRDSGLYFLPHKALIAQALRQGRLPEWNPFEYGGVPLLADPNFNTFHPLSLLTDLLPLPLGFGVFLCVNAILAAYGARSLGRALGLDHGASLACGLFFAWSGPTVSFLLTGQAVASCALPWLCAAGARLGRSRTIGSILGCALAAALELLSGTPEIGACGFALAGILALSEALDGPPARGRPAAIAAAQFALATLLGAALSAIQLWPSTLFLRASSRSAGFSSEQALAWSLHPLRLPGLAIPFFTGDVDGPGAPSWLFTLVAQPYVQEIYLGASAMLLAIIGIRGRFARRLWPLLAGSLAIAMVAFGNHLPLASFLWRTFPPLRLVRFPEKLIVPLSLAVAVCAGAGWERASGWLAALPERPGLRKEALASRSMMAGILSLVLALAASSSALWLPALVPDWAADRQLSLSSGALSSLSLELVVLALALILIALFARGLLRPPLLTALLAALLAGEFAVPALRLDRTAPAAVFSNPPALPAILSEDAGAPASTFRVSSSSLGVTTALLDSIAAVDGSLRSLALYRLRGAALFESASVFASIRSDRGYSGFTPGAMKRLYVSSPGGDALDLLGVRYAVEFGFGHSEYAQLGFIPRPDLASAALARTPSLPEGALRVYENPRAMPGAWLSPSALEGAGTGVTPRCDGRFIPWLDAEDLRMLPPAIPRGASCASLASASAEAGHASLSLFQPERETIAVDAAAPSILVLGESALPGWRAFVDGSETPVLRADGALRACVVPQGRHEVSFVYAAPGLREGALLSAAALVVWLAVAGLALRATAVSATRW